MPIKTSLLHVPFFHETIHSSLFLQHSIVKVANDFHVAKINSQLSESMSHQHLTQLTTPCFLNQFLHLGCETSLFYSSSYHTGHFSAHFWLLLICPISKYWTIPGLSPRTSPLLSTLNPLVISSSLKALIIRG